MAEIQKEESNAIGNIKDIMKEGNAKDRRIAKINREFTPAQKQKLLQDVLKTIKTRAPVRMKKLYPNVVSNHLSREEKLQMARSVAQAMCKEFKEKKVYEEDIPETLEATATPYDRVRRNLLAYDFLMKVFMFKLSDYYSRYMCYLAHLKYSDYYLHRYLIIQTQKG